MGRIPDRFWWVQRYGGVLIMAGSLWCVAGWLIISLRLIQYPIHEAGWLLVSAWLVAGIKTILDVGLNGLLAAFFLRVGWACFVGAKYAHDRYQRRLRAIAGDQEAVPCAVLKTDPARAPDLSGERLELLWRATLSGRVIGILVIYLFLVPLLGLFAGFSAYVAYGLVSWSFVGLSPEWLAVLIRGAFLIIMLVVLVPMLFGIGMAFCYLPAWLGKSFGAVASDEGILIRPQRVGRARWLRWEEIRFFEVGGLAGGIPGKYRLYGDGTNTQWRNITSTKWISVGMPPEEYTRRSQELLDLIVARTGLLPRTFDNKLAKPQEAGEPLESKRQVRF